MGRPVGQVRGRRRLAGQPAAPLADAGPVSAGLCRPRLASPRRRRVPPHPYACGLLRQGGGIEQKVRTGRTLTLAAAGRKPGRADVCARAGRGACHAARHTRVSGGRRGVGSVRTRREVVTTVYILAGSGVRPSRVRAEERAFWRAAAVGRVKGQRVEVCQEAQARLLEGGNFGGHGARFLVSAPG